MLSELDNNHRRTIFENGIYLTRILERNNEKNVLKERNNVESENNHRYVQFSGEGFCKILRLKDLPV